MTAEQRSCPAPLRYVARLWIPLATFALLTKCAKAIPLAQARGHTLGLRSFLGISSTEILFFGIGLLAWGGLVGSRRRTIRLASIALLHVVVPVLFSLLAADYLYFKASGALADWRLLADGLRGAPHLARLYQSQLSPLRSVLLALPWAYSLAVYFAGGGRALTRAPLGAPVPQRQIIRLGVTIALLAAVTGWARVDATVATLRGGVLSTALADAMADVAAVCRASSHESSKTGDVVGPLLLTPGTPGRTRNVVIIALESVGASATGLYQAQRDTTPFLEELARRGALVERAYTVVPHTSKALVALFCGVSPKMQPGADESRSDAIPARCLPALLRERGYATAFFQPAEEHYERRAQLVGSMGFEVFRGKESIDGAGLDESSYFGWEDDSLLQPVRRWLLTRESRPFLMAVLTLASHHPYNVPRGFPTQQLADEPVVNDYLNTVAYSDRFVRKLFSIFEEQGLLDDTLFVVLGDHGEAFGQHGRRQHDGVPYEEGIRIPMVLLGPEISPGRTISGLRQVTDLAPTVTAALGLAADRPFVGKDILRSFGHERIYVSCYLGDYCMASIDGWTKVIHHFGRFPDEMFDLQHDPNELRDLLPDGPDEQHAIADRTVRRMTSAKAATNALYDRRAAAQKPLFVTKTQPAVGVQYAWGSFESFAELTGFDIEPRTFPAGGCVTVTALFHVMAKPTKDWELFLHLEGTGIVNGDHVPAQGSYPVSRWEPGDFIVDRHAICPRPRAEPEQLHVRLGFWEPSTGTRAAVKADAPLTATPEQSLELGTVDVTSVPMDRAAFVTERAPFPPTADVAFGHLMRLLSATPDRARIKPGIKVTTTCLFQATAKLGARYELRTELKGPGTRAGTHIPVSGLAPLSTWRVGQYVRDLQVTPTRTDDETGRYRLLLTLFDTQLRRAVSPTGTGLPIEGRSVEIASFEVMP